MVFSELESRYPQKQSPSFSFDLNGWQKIINNANPCFHSVLQDTVLYSSPQVSVHDCLSIPAVLYNLLKGFLKISAQGLPHTNQIRIKRGILRQEYLVRAPQTILLHTESGKPLSYALHRIQGRHHSHHGSTWLSLVLSSALHFKSSTNESTESKYIMNIIFSCLNFI